MDIGFYQSASALHALERYQQAVSHNLAASEVPGFKRLMVGVGAVSQGAIGPSGDAFSLNIESRHPTLTVVPDLTPGGIQPTGNPLDVAIEGEGYFSLKGDNGATFYTRNGSFHLTADGMLIDAQGRPVLAEGSEVRLDPAGGTPTVLPDGTLMQGESRVGQLSVTRFGNPAALERVGSAFRISPEINAFARQVENPRFQQGFVESANVNPLEEMVSLISISRAYEANQQVINTYEDRSDRALRALSPA